MVAKRNDRNPVTLTCNTATPGAVTWKFHDDDMMVMEDVVLDEYVKQDSHNLNMSYIDTPMLGQYSCWRGGAFLSSVYLLVEAEEKLGEILSFLSAWLYISYIYHSDIC